MEPNENVVQADCCDGLRPGDTKFGQWGTVQRFALSDSESTDANLSGSESHFVFQGFMGMGSAWPVIATLGSRMLRAGRVGEEIPNALDDAYFQSNFSGARVAQWAGEVGASYLAASLGYNSWAARGSGSGGG
ncbi:hypothetical protein H0H81_003200, partial [Sphagnurus paluster]